MLSIYSACQAENPTRNHFRLTGVWSRVRSHMGSAYFSLPSVGGQNPICTKHSAGVNPCVCNGEVLAGGMHGGILPMVGGVTGKNYGLMGESGGSTADAGASGSSSLHRGWGEGSKS